MKKLILLSVFFCSLLAKAQIQPIFPYYIYQALIANTYSPSTANPFVVQSQLSGGGIGTVTSVTVTSPMSVINPSTTPSISISQSNTSTNGYLSSTDWNTFNNKASSSATFTTNGVAQSLGSSSNTIGAGTGISVTSNSVINVANTAVAAGTYSLASVTVNAQGQITSASNGIVAATSVVSGNAGITVVNSGSTYSVSNNYSGSNKNVLSSGKPSPIKKWNGTVNNASFAGGSYIVQKISNQTATTFTALSAIISSTVVGGLFRIGIYTADDPVTTNTLTLISGTDTGDLSASLAAGIVTGTITPTALDPNKVYFAVIQPSILVNMTFAYYMDCDMYKSSSGLFYSCATSPVATYGALPSTLTGVQGYTFNNSGGGYQPIIYITPQ